MDFIPSYKFMETIQKQIEKEKQKKKRLLKPKKIFQGYKDKKIKNKK